MIDVAKFTAGVIEIDLALARMRYDRSRIEAALDEIIRAIDDPMDIPVLLDAFKAVAVRDGVSPQNLVAVMNYMATATRDMSIATGHAALLKTRRILNGLREAIEPAQVTQKT